MPRRFPYISRIFLSLLSLALIGWLALSPHPITSRIQAIDRGIGSGAIGGISARDTAELQNTLSWLYATAGFVGNVTLNQQYSERAHNDNILQVFVTSEESESFTHCGAGNAVYDAELDAIFIDRGILSSSEWGTLLANEDGGIVSLSLDDAPWLRTYLRFILLHELGHRKLHRHLSASFDLRSAKGAPDLRRMEAQADTFAYQMMQRSYETAGRFGVKTDEKESGDTIHYAITSSTSTDNKVQAAVVEMAQMVAASALFLSSKTPLRGDAAHPGYVDRARGFVRASLADQQLDSNLRVLTEYVETSLERMQEVAADSAASFSSDQLIEGAGFDDKGLLVIGGNRVDHIPYRTLQRLVDHGSSVDIRDLGASSLKFDRPAVGKGREIVDWMWSTQGDDSVIAFHNGDWARLSRDFSSIELIPQAQIQGKSLREVVSSTLPSLHTVVSTYSSGDGDVFYALKGTKVTGLISSAQLVQWLAASGYQDQFALVPDLCQIADDLLYIPLFKNSSQRHLWGYVEVDVASMSPIKLHRLKTSFAVDRAIGSDKSSDGMNARLVFAFEQRLVQPYLVALASRADAPGAAETRLDRMQYWRLNEDRDPELISEQTLQINQLPDQLFRDSNLSPSLWRRSILPLARRGMLVNIDDDSVYWLEGDKKKLVFHPGAESIRMASAPNGMVVLYMHPSYRVFILDPSSKPEGQFAQKLWDRLKTFF